MRAHRHDGGATAAGATEVLDPGRFDVVLLDAGGVLLNPDWERGSAILRRHGIAATSVQLAQAELRARRLMDDAGFVHAIGDITQSDGYLMRAHAIRQARRASAARALR